MPKSCTLLQAEGLLRPLTGRFQKGEGLWRLGFRFQALVLYFTQVPDLTFNPPYMTRTGTCLLVDGNKELGIYEQMLSQNT